MSSPPLPELRESILQADEVRAMAEAIEAQADEVEAQVKGAATAYAAPGKIPVAEAIASLLDGDVGAAQLRYVLDGEIWIDTIMRRPDGFRVVRVKQSP